MSFACVEESSLTLAAACFQKGKTPLSQKKSAVTELVLGSILKHL